jgi:hypothetical protein
MGSFSGRPRSRFAPNAYLRHRRRFFADGTHGNPDREVADVIEVLAKRALQRWTLAVERPS